MAMAYKLDYPALREDARKVGVGLVIAGIIGTVVEDVPVPFGLIAIVLGVALIVIGALHGSNQDA